MSQFVFSLLESKKEITDAQRILEKTIHREFNAKVTRDIGLQGGSMPNAKIFTDGEYWFWAFDIKGRGTPNPRRWYGFGLFEERGNLKITVETNTPYDGINNTVAVFFARNNRTGVIYLLHSGKVGGGKGVGKTTFLAWRDKFPIKVINSKGDIRDGVLVMPIAGTGATRSAISYIDSVALFKQAVDAGETKTPEFKQKK